MNFHAHVYYTPATRASAFRLREQLREAAATSRLAGLEVGPMEDELRGPHPRPMFELGLDAARFGELTLWLMFHRGEHPVLIHAVTGSDPVDHDRYSLWLGDPLPLDATRLDPPGVSRVPAFAPGEARALWLA